MLACSTSGGSSWTGCPVVTPTLVPPWTASSMSWCTLTMGSLLSRPCGPIYGGRNTSHKDSWFSSFWPCPRRYVQSFGHVVSPEGGCISRYSMSSHLLPFSQTSTFRLTRNTLFHKRRSVIRMALLLHWMAMWMGWHPRKPLHTGKWGGTEAWILLQS